MKKFTDLKTPWANPETNVLEYCLQHFDYFKDHYRDFHDACEDELDFVLRLNHYVNDRGNTRNKRTLLKGAETFHIHRHKLSAVAKAESYIDAHARYGASPEAEYAAYVMKHLLQQQFYDPVKRYRRNKRRVISGAFAARAWGMALETKRDSSGYMGLVTRTIEPTCLMVHPGWADPHDPTCPSLMEDLMLRTEDAYAMGLARKWKNLDKLIADGNTPERMFGRVGQTARGITSTSGLPARGHFMGEFTRIVMWWVREDHTRGYKNIRDRERKKSEPTRMCDTCGATFMPEELAGTMELPCPVCERGSTIPIKYRTAEVELLFPNGRLYVFCPELNFMLDEGSNWPYQCRSFPHLWFTAYEHPREPYGQSDASLYWGSQVMLNRLRMFGYNQMMNSPDILIAPFSGLVDAKRRPFVYSDEQGRIAYFTNFQEAQGIKHFQGPGLPQAWSTLHGALMNDFTRTWGINDMGLDASQSRKIPVGTMQRLMESAELPVDEHIARYREEEAMLWNVGSDMMLQVVRAEGPRDVVAEEDGQRTVLEALPEDMHPCDITMTGQPDLRGLKKEELDGIMQVMSVPPYMRREVSRLTGVPMQSITNIEKAERQFAMQQAAQAAGPGAMPPGGGAPMEPPTEEPPPEWATEMAAGLGLQ